ncbi:MAG: hypothetical protein FD179_1778 [Erysipelotrichaceae bacterium]|nr:MAG: hypothetical protein FD179_1778 [Erysipelotrichaceae bacterium]
MLSLGLMFGLASCVSKVKVDLDQVQFKSLFIGSVEKLTASELLLLNEAESDDLIRILQVEDWTVSSYTPLNIPEALFGLVDQNGLQFSISKVEGKMLIKIQSKKSIAIVYETIFNVQTVYRDTILPLTEAIKLRNKIATRTFISGNAEVNSYASFREFPFTKDSSEALIEVLNTSEWKLSALDQIAFEEHEMKVNVSTVIDLYFHATETQSFVIAVNSDRTYYAKVIFEISLEHYQAIKAKLLELRNSAYEKPGDTILNSVYNKVEFHLWETYPSALKHLTYSITKDQSTSAKADMDYDHWIKLDNSISIDKIFLTLTDTQGYITDFAYTTKGVVAIITSINDASFKEVYGIPDNRVEIIYAFSVPCTDAFPAQNVFDFAGTTLKILEDADQGTYRNYQINASEYAKFKNLLEIDTWRLDPVHQYDFGAVPLLYFEDKSGNHLSVYSLFGLTVILVTKPNYDGLTPYLAPARIHDALKSYITTNYPKSE